MKNSQTLQLLIEANGNLTAIYDDALVDLFAEGQVNITRASHVEPTTDGRWTADLAPAGGPVLGPFITRQQALDEEVAWLKQKLFG
jgi:hypothetical protein